MRDVQRIDWKKLFRKIALGWITFVIGADLIFMIYMLLFPNCPLYEIAKDFKWGVTNSWMGTTLPTIIVMGVIVWNLVIKKAKLVDGWYFFLVIISTLWVLELAVYETLIGAYHWSKLVDALRWTTLLLAATHIYVYDLKY